MKLSSLSIIASLAVAAPLLWAEDTTSAGKASTTTQSEQTGKVTAQPSSEKPELKRKEADFGKSSTTTAPNGVKKEGEAAEVDAAESGVKALNEEAATAAQREGERRAAQKRAEEQAAAAAGKAAAPPVAGNNGTVGGAKAGE